MPIGWWPAVQVLFRQPLGLAVSSRQGHAREVLPVQWGGLPYGRGHDVLLKVPEKAVRVEPGWYCGLVALHELDAPGDSLAHGPRLQEVNDGNASSAGAVKLWYSWEGQVLITRSQAPSAAHQRPFSVAKARAGAELRDTLRPIQAAFMLNHHTGIKVTLVDKSVHHALVAVGHFDCANLSPSHDDDRWTNLCFVAVPLKVYCPFVIIECHLKGSCHFVRANQILRGKGEVGQHT